jgi:DNA polymerase-3 subunit delta
LTPEQFLARISKQPPAPAYLFLGPELYFRRLCKEALIKRVLGEAGEQGLTLIDLENTNLSEVLDDARSYSLFSSERLIWVSSAELALPKRITVSDEQAGQSNESLASSLQDYLRHPTPGTVVVFDCSRYDFTGEDRAKLERVEKFYVAVPAIVEFRRLTAESSRFLSQDLAKKQGLQLAGAELAALIEACAGDASRIASEIEKLSLFVGAERPVTMQDLRALVPNAAESTIFELVQALGKRDRAAALRSLDILIREGEYLPLALTFLNTQFRLALAAKEARISSVQQAQSFFVKSGVRIWRERAEQILTTAAAFTKEHLARALALIYETDKKFRDGYGDDRLIMETLVLALTVR